MRNFIISDLHGNGNIYNSVIKYLENVNKDDELTLYINGDLIDRGLDSTHMLLDVRERIINKKGFNIKYLGGNHELMMYQALHNDKSNFFEKTIWYSNGGGITNNTLQDLVDQKEKLEIIKFISQLDIYYKFKETLDDKQIVLVHAKCPKIVNDMCDLKIEDNNKIYKYVWTREEDLSIFLKESLGNDNYFTIIGHTPVDNKKGYKYYKKYNCINIDGGCGAYVKGFIEYDHVPLVEIDENNNRLIILTFNNNNEIIMGNYFLDGNSIKMENNELNNKRKYIDKNVKIKKLTKGDLK